MIINTSEELNHSITQLRNDLSQFSTHAVVGWIGTTLIRGFVDAVRDFEMQSPYKQSYYILGLLMSSSEPSVIRDMSETEYHSVVLQVNDIFNYYRKLIMDTDISSESINPNKAKAVALFTFVHYFYSFRLQISIEQQEARINDFFCPFAMLIENKLNISLESLVEIVKAISDQTTIRYDEWRDKCLEYQKHNPKKILPDALVAMSDDPFILQKKDIMSQFNVSDVNAFWSNFVSIRGENQDFFYPTDANSAESKPLFEIDSDTAFMPAGNPLRLAVFAQLSQIVIDSSHQKKFFRNRDKLLEQQTENAFRNFFGGDAEYYHGVYDTCDSQFEHDLIIY